MFGPSNTRWPSSLTTIGSKKLKLTIGGEKSTGVILPLMKLFSASFNASTQVNAVVALLKVLTHGNDRIVIDECSYLAGRGTTCRKKIGAVAIFGPFFFSKCQQRVTGACTMPLLIDILKHSGKTEIITYTLVIVDNLGFVWFLSLTPTKLYFFI